MSQPTESGLDLVPRAQAFATQAHARIDQRRRYSNQPYDVHLKSVAGIVASYCDDPEMVAAAWLHDVVEDTTITLEELAREFGPGVAALVDQLTDVSRAGDGNRKVRKAIDRGHLALATPRAQTIKLADLIDNAVDICKHDSKFARVFLAEMGELLEVLTAGDPRLRERAHRTFRKLTDKLKSDALHGEEGASLPAFGPRQRRLFEIFTKVLAAEDIAEPLPRREEGLEAPEAARWAGDGDHELIGLEGEAGLLGFVLVRELAGGRCRDHLHPFAATQLVEGRASISDVVQVLTRHEFCFTLREGQVDGFIGRSQMQSPPVRMWLFGIITSYELGITQQIQERMPAQAWRSHLSPGRLEKAERLQRDRRAKGHQVGLLDCLQLADKLEIMVSETTLMRRLGFDSKGKAQRVARELESLRNHLAHAQDIVTYDWPQIARLARRVDRLAEGLGFDE